MVERFGLVLVTLTGLAFALPAQPPNAGPTPNGPPTVPEPALVQPPGGPGLPQAGSPGVPPVPGSGAPGALGGGGLSGGFAGQLPGGFGGQPPGGLGGFAPPVAAPKFTFPIPAFTKPSELLPTPPKQVPAGPAVTDDLAKVPEVAFAEQPEKAALADQPREVAHQLAKVAHLNAQKTDLFLTTLLANRPDLRGLPFVMGDACRTTGERTKQFSAAVGLVRVALTNGQPDAFWQQFTGLCAQQDAARPRGDKALAEHVHLARMAAATQMMAAEAADLRAGLAKYLTGVPHVEATRQLAKLALFSPEEDVRSAALDALKVRREKDYTDILVGGLRYPWPAVARRAADAVAKLERTDLIPELVKILDEPDPRLPKTTGKGSTVRELVKLNHHRNCLLCHPSGQPGQVPADAILAEVPVQGQPLPSLTQGYGRSQPDLMVRVDVTYLRGDFSLMLPVADAHPWPDAQRFDFLVRERAVSAAEADRFEAALTVTEPGVLSPYHKAALAALRDITGKDTAPTAGAWRELLKLKTTD